MLQNLALSLPELTVHILSYLDSPSLVNCRQVSKEWFELIESETSLWSNFVLPEDFGWNHRMLELFTKKSRSRLKHIEIETDILGGYDSTPNWMNPFEPNGYSNLLVQTIQRSEDTLKTFIYRSRSAEGETGLNLLPILDFSYLVTFYMSDHVESLERSTTDLSGLTFTNSNFTSSSLVNVSLPNRWESSSTQNALYNLGPLLQRYSNSLKCLSIRMNGLFNFFDGSLLLPNLKVLQISLRHDHPNLDLSSAFPQVSKVKFNMPGVPVSLRLPRTTTGLRLSSLNFTQIECLTFDDSDDLFSLGQLPELSMLKLDDEIGFDPVDFFNFLQSRQGKHFKLIIKVCNFFPKMFEKIKSLGIELVDLSKEPDFFGDADF